MFICVAQRVVSTSPRHKSAKGTAGSQRLLLRPVKVGSSDNVRVTGNMVGSKGVVSEKVSGERSSRVLYTRPQLAQPSLSPLSLPPPARSPWHPARKHVVERKRRAQRIASDSRAPVLRLLINGTHRIEAPRRDTLTEMTHHRAYPVQLLCVGRRSRCPSSLA